MDETLSVQLQPEKMLGSSLPAVIASSIELLRQSVMWAWNPKLQDLK